MGWIFFVFISLFVLIKLFGDVVRKGYCLEINSLYFEILIFLIFEYFLMILYFDNCLFFINEVLIVEFIFIIFFIVLVGLVVGFKKVFLYFEVVM